MASLLLRPFLKTKWEHSKIKHSGFSKCWDSSRIEERATWQSNSKNASWGSMTPKYVLSFSLTSDCLWGFLHSLESQRAEHYFVTLTLKGINLPVTYGNTEGNGARTGRGPRACFRRAVKLLVSHERCNQVILASRSCLSDAFPPSVPAKGRLHGATPRGK